MDPVFLAFASVSIVSLVSLCGVLAFSFSRASLRASMPILVGLAAGALLGDAFIHIIPESLEALSGLTFGLSALSGVVILFLLEKYLRWHHAHHADEEEHMGHEHYETGTHETRVHLAPLVIVADGLHNVVDGAVIAASYLVSPMLGVATTIAVFLHEIPQEIADYALLLHAGYSRLRALFWNFVSGLTALIGAGAVIVLGTQIEGVVAYLFAATAGAFIYLATTDLIPELHTNTSRQIGSFIAFLVGIALMGALTILE